MFKRYNKIMDSGEGWLSKIIHSSPPSEPDLRSKRGFDESGRPKKHVVSRHVNLDYPLVSNNGTPFRQGTLFPPHLRPGDITKVVKMVAGEYQRYVRGMESVVRKAIPAGPSVRITADLGGKYGLHKVGGFVRSGKICTIFPEKDN